MNKLLFRLGHTCDKTVISFCSSQAGIEPGTMSKATHLVFIVINPGDQPQLILRSLAILSL
jgi:hypothetical protein